MCPFPSAVCRRATTYAVRAHRCRRPRLRGVTRSSGVWGYFRCFDVGLQNRVEPLRGAFLGLRGRCSGSAESENGRNQWKGPHNQDHFKGLRAEVTSRGGRAVRVGADFHRSAGVCGASRTPRLRSSKSKEQNHARSRHCSNPRRLGRGKRSPDHRPGCLRFPRPLLTQQTRARTMAPPHRGAVESADEVPRSWSFWCVS